MPASPAALIALAAGLFAFGGCGVAGDRTIDDGRGARVSSFRAGLQEREFQLDRFDRSYLLYVPRAIVDGNQKRPLVLVNHGGGGTNRQMMRFTNRRWNELADLYGFSVVYPNAYDRFWDFGEGRTSGRLDPRIDDLSYFRIVLDELARDLPVDRTRVFATGISRGGQASYFLACRFPGRIRAIAPIAMPLPAFLEDDCRREAPTVGLALFNGTADPLVPYDGGWIAFGNNRRDRVLSTDGTIALWQDRNGCRELPDHTGIIDTADDDMRVLRSEWSTCSGAPVLLYRIEGGGHSFPSGRRTLIDLITGPVNRDIHGADEAWAFFSLF